MVCLLFRKQIGARGFSCSLTDILSALASSRKFSQNYQTFQRRALFYHDTLDRQSEGSRFVSLLASALYTCSYLKSMRPELCSNIDFLDQG